MQEKRWLYFALGVATVISAGAVTNQLVPLAPATGVALSDLGVTFPDGSEQTTAADNPDPPCFNTTQRFVDCSNGTVTDTVTELIYLKNANCLGSLDFPAANQTASNLADGQCGLTDGSRPGDWRLPTLEEWRAILDRSCSTNPKIVGNGSPTTGCYSDNAGANEWASVANANGDYWSSTTLDGVTTKVYVVGFIDGAVLDQNKTATNQFVWPVRGQTTPTRPLLASKEWDNDGSSASLSIAWSDLSSIRIRHPASGFIHCIGTGHVDYDAADFTHDITVGWGTTSGDVAPESYNRVSLPVGSDTTTYVPIASMRTFAVDAAGRTTYWFKGRISGGGASDIDYFLQGVTCMYFQSEARD